METAQNPNAFNADFIATVRERLIPVREMESLDDIPIVFASKDRAISYIAKNLPGNSAADNSNDKSLAYGKLRLLPPGADLTSNLLSFYSSQTMAFYDSKSKRVVLPVGIDFSAEGLFFSESDEKVIAHELVHAYQDQKFSIGDRLRANGNGDAALALRSVAEGDAVLSEYAYIYGSLDEGLPSNVRQRLDAQDGNEDLSGMPMLLSDRVRFQYFAGARFVTHALDRTGWLAVDRLYRLPPLSTEQVLHPEKYFDLPDPPSRVELRNLSRLFPSPRREIENDVLGELSVRCLFKQFLDPSVAASAARGWDGDRFVAYRTGDDVAFVWATVWDSDVDAEEFHERYNNILAMKYRPRPSETHFYIERRGLAVLVIEGLERQDVGRHIDAIWAEMVVQRESIQPLISSASMSPR